jgi:ABC-2 type transport system permease protein
VSALGLQARAFAAVMRRDLTVFMSYRTRLASQALTAVFSLTLFHYVSQLVHVRGFPSPHDYFGFVVVGIAMVSVLYSCFSIADLVRQELVAGTFERLLLSPFGAVQSVIAMALFPLAYAFVLAAVTLGLACGLYGLSLNGASALLALPAALLAIAAFLPFGLLFAALTITVKQGSVGTSWVIALLSIVGGLYFPVSLLPAWLRAVAHAQPFTAATAELRHLLVGSPLGEAQAAALGKMALFAAVLVPGAIWLLRGAVRTAQRRGTVIEY